MNFKQRVIASIFVIVLAILLVYFFLSIESEKSGPSTEAEVATRAFKDQAPTETASSSKKDHVENGVEESTGDYERKAFGALEPEERIDAIQELAQRGKGKQSVRTIVTILHNDKDQDVREAALDALEELQGLSFDVLTKVALDDPEPSIRIRAIEMLGEMDKRDSRTADLLRRIAKIDRDEEVRKSAKEYLADEDIGQ